jgi:flagellar hook assembly protein FlgD
MRLSNPNKTAIMPVFMLDQKSGRFNFTISDINGRTIYCSGDQEYAGRIFTWDGRMRNGAEITRGIYLVQYRSGNSLQTRKFVISR